MNRIEIRLSRRDLRLLEQKKQKEKLTKRMRDRIDILLLAHRRKNTEEIVDLLQICPDTVWRVKKRWVDENVFAAIGEKPRSGQPRKYTIKHNTELIAIACSKAPEGAEHWTLELLKNTMRKNVKGCKTINKETIRLMLKKTNVNHG